MQASGGGASQSQSQYGGGDMNPPPPPAAIDGGGGGHVFGADQSQQVVEAASPISSRLPAGNLDEFLSGGGDEADRAGGSGGGGNRWPRQETLALLRIRSEMDATFRDATLKGPLWEDVSRKLGELGFKRSAKKCKEKFENVHKYYKRTKEGRAGRQDGKSYRFFSELEALHASTTTTTPTTPSSVPGIFVSPSSTSAPPINPTPISSIRFGNTTPKNVNSQVAYPIPGMFGAGSISISVSTAPQQPVVPVAGNPDQGGAASFSTNTASTSEKSDEDDEEDYNLSSRKRKRGAGGSSTTTKRMMEFFEGLMKQVMQKQEAMQQRFLEAVEKREQDRMIREEAWKRQEMARLGREHDLLAQERAVSASRDAAIINFLQKITGQTIQLPPHLNINPVPPPQPPPQAPPPQPQQRQHHRPQPPPPPQQQQPAPPASTDVVMALPEQQVAPPPPQEMSGGGGSGGFEGPSPSRWPKTEVLALINLRSGLESRYQEAGPKGPLWEEISAGMKRLGYNRNSKRCKEKWENINKYFKKVKESNKKRPEDAKTCPYFHQLDALYRKKILPAAATSGNNQNASHQQQEGFKLVLDPIPAPSPAPAPTNVPPQENKNGGTVVEQAMAANLFGEPTKKPEDIVKEMMAQQQRQQLMVDDYDKIEEGESDDIEDEEDEDDDEEVEEEEEERKMDYKIEFQRQNTTTGPSNGGGNGAPSFLSMVQ